MSGGTLSSVYSFENFAMRFTGMLVKRFGFIQKTSHG